MSGETILITEAGAERVATQLPGYKADTRLGPRLLDTQLIVENLIARSQALMFYEKTVIAELIANENKST